MAAGGITKTACGGRGNKAAPGGRGARAGRHVATPLNKGPRSRRQQRPAAAAAAVAADKELQAAKEPQAKSAVCGALQWTPESMLGAEGMFGDALMGEPLELSEIMMDPDVSLNWFAEMEPLAPDAGSSWPY